MLGRLCRGRAQWRHFTMYKPILENANAPPALFSRMFSRSSKQVVDETLLEQHFIEHDLEPPLMRPEEDEALDSSFKNIWNDSAPEQRIGDTMKAWTDRGNAVTRELVNRLQVRMCARQQYILAYMLSRWVCRWKPYELSDHDSLVMLHLATQLGKETRARSAFSSLRHKSELAYNKLLKVYTDGNWDTTAETLFNQMKEHRLITGPDAISHMIGMYLRLVDIDKAKYFVSEMEEARMAGIEPNARTYRTLLGGKDVLGMVDLDASIERFLDKLGDGKLKGQEWRDVIRLYGGLGNTAGVERLWKDMKAGVCVPDPYYYAAAEAFGKAGDMSRFKDLCNEVESRNERMREDQCLVMIRVYASRGEMDKAEAVLKKAEGMKPSCLVFQEMVAGYLKAEDVDMALEKVEEALETFNSRFYSKQVFPSVLMVMKELARSGDVSTGEELVKALMENKYKPDARIFNSVLEAHLEAREPAHPTFLKRMQRNRVIPDERTQQLLEQLKEFREDGEIKGFPGPSRALDARSEEHAS